MMDDWDDADVDAAACAILGLLPSIMGLREEKDVWYDFRFRQGNTRDLFDLAVQYLEREQMVIRRVSEFDGLTTLRLAG